MQHQYNRAWATINRRLNALKHFFDFCVDQQLVAGNPVKPSHFVRCGRPVGLENPNQLNVSAFDAARLACRAAGCCGNAAYNGAL
jgi:site-specific recombinase XerC